MRVITFNKGFSLVELLVAMSILIMVTLIGNYGYNLYARYWQKELGHYQEVFERIKGVSRLHNVIISIKPYLIRGDENEIYHYFEGTQSVLRSVVASSLTNPRYPAIFEMVVITNNNIKSLVYRERVMDTGPILNEKQLGDYSQEFTLLTNISDITFEYFGWENYQVRSQALNEQSGDLLTQRWFGLYSGKDTLIPPNVIRISIIDIDKKRTEFELPLTEVIEQQLEFHLNEEE